VGAIRSRLGADSEWAEPIRPNRYIFFFLFKQILDVHKYILNEKLEKIESGTNFEFGTNFKFGINFELEQF
jgi:hypothetical protein